MTFAHEFRESRDWLLQHKRDPFLWLIILGPLVLAAITFWGVVVFPPSDAIRVLRQVLPGADDITMDPKIAMEPKNFPNCRKKKYIFGYEFAIHADHGEDVGRICRDIVNGGWVLDIDNPKFKYLEPQ